jgi:hypothetical protein
MPIEQQPIVKKLRDAAMATASQNLLLVASSDAS